MASSSDSGALLAQKNISFQLYGNDVWTGYQPRNDRADVVQGWNGDHPVFEKLISDMSKNVVIDVEVWKGQSTIYLANQLVEKRGDGCVISVDTFLGSVEHWDEDLELFSRKYGRPDLYETFLDNVFHSGLKECVVPMPQTSISAAEILVRRNITAGLIHVDASHEYADVLADLRAYWPLVSPGGYLVADDYDPSWPGVVRAVNEFCKEIGVSFYVDHPKCVIRKA